MRRKRVYRVEYTETKGIGFYCHYGSSALSKKAYKLRTKVIDKHSHGDYRPPINAVVTEFSVTYKCGCLGVKQLRKWFDGFFDDILALPSDFQVVSYLPKKLLEGSDGLQVAFIPEEGSRQIWKLKLDSQKSAKI